VEVTLTVPAEAISPEEGNSEDPEGNDVVVE
jgi:hypothetical protein